MPWAHVLTSLFLALPMLGLWLGAPWLCLLIGVFALPLAEWFFGRHSLGRPIKSKWLLRLMMFAVILQIPALALSATKLEPTQWFWMALSMGYIAGSTGIVLAHELGHRRASLDQWLSRLLLVLVAWGPYRVEHNRGHHRHAATFDDPATARQSESLYRFMPRYLLGVYVNGWRLSKHPSARWHEAAVLTLMSGVFAILLWLAGGWAALLFWMVQAATALFLVSAVDYIEHWGLVRHMENHRLERMGPQHTWDCGNTVTEALLFNLPRHAHHHLFPGKEGHNLQRTPSSPQMPTGYAGMVLLASCPWAWFKIMQPRLQHARVATAISSTNPP